MVGERRSMRALKNRDSTPEYGLDGSCRSPYTLKNRKRDGFQAEAGVKHTGIILAREFLNRVGRFGRGSMVSTFGKTSVSP